MFVIFNEKETGQPTAVNPDNVLRVVEFPFGPKIIFVDGSYVIVTDTFLSTVARLNQN
jgi:hypothetical protein